MVSRAIDDLSSAAEINLSEIEEIHRRSFQDIGELRMFIFQQIVNNDLVADMYNEAISEMLNPKPTQAEFVNAIAYLITDSINDKGIFKSSTS